MKLSKKVSLTISSLAFVVYVFGVLASGVWAQAGDYLSSEVNASDLELVETEGSSGFGRVVSNWFEDIKARVTNDPEVLEQQAEKALARIEGLIDPLALRQAQGGIVSGQEGVLDPSQEGELGSGQEEGVDLVELEQARLRYEEKLARAQELMGNLDDAKKERMLSRITKHEAVLEQVFEVAPETATAGLARALENAVDHRLRILENFSEREQVELQERVESRREALAGLVEEGEVESDELKKVRELRVEELRAKKEIGLEALKEKYQAEDEEMVEERDAETVAKENFRKRLEQDRLEAAERELESQKKAEEKFKERVKAKYGDGSVKEKEKVAPMSTSDIRKVQGAVDYQPVGLWERLGWWLER